MSVSLHSRACQAAATAVLLSLAAIALPSFAADSAQTAVTVQSAMPLDAYYAGIVANTFKRAGSVQSGQYDNSSLDRSAFDFAAYVNNTCFRPTSFDVNACQNTYGPYADFKQNLLNGTLLAILKKNNLASDKDQKLIDAVIADLGLVKVQALSASGTTVQIKTTNATLSAPMQPELDNLSNRTATLWGACKARYTDKNEQYSCFQRNHRLLINGLDIRSNLY